jgi:hypothetical protein
VGYRATNLQDHHLYSSVIPTERNARVEGSPHLFILEIVILTLSEAEGEGPASKINPAPTEPTPNKYR